MVSPTKKRSVLWVVLYLRVFSVFHGCESNLSKAMVFHDCESNLSKAKFQAKFLP